MTVYQRPGVYYERLDASAPRIAAIRSDVAGFVGIAERGPIDTPIPVESFRQFESHFGGFIGAGFLAFVVNAFFENGGRRCWIVRVAGGDRGEDAKPAFVTISLPAPGSGSAMSNVFRVRASSPGEWGNNLSVELREIRAAQTIIVNHLDGERASTVTSTGGFHRGAFVRLRQARPGPPAIEHRILGDVDHEAGRLIWSEDSAPSAGAPLTGFATDAPIEVTALEYELFVRRDDRLVEVHRRLSLTPLSDDYIGCRLGPMYDSAPIETQRTQAQTPRLIDVVHESEGVGPPQMGQSQPPAAGVQRRLFGGADGLRSLGVFDFIGREASPLDSDERQRVDRRGMRALDLVAEICTVAIPDVLIQPIPAAVFAPPRPCVPDPCQPLPGAAVEMEAPSAPKPNGVGGEQPPKFSENQVFAVQHALVEQCERRRDRIALLDPPFECVADEASGVSNVRRWRARIESKFAALYWPWPRVVNPIEGASELLRAIPPSGHVAGRFVATDFGVGVHRAPCNSALAWTHDLTLRPSDETHGLLNSLGVNVIVATPSRGIRIMGARTTSSDPDARYLNVRRLTIMIVKALDLSTQWAVFEPNHRYTRAKIRLAINSFLGSLWERGALMGDRPQAAFFVRCDDSNNPAESRELGRLMCEVGFAPSVPFEFVVVRVGRIDSVLHVTETIAKGVAA